MDKILSKKKKKKEEVHYQNEKFQRKDYFKALITVKGDWW